MDFFNKGLGWVLKFCSNLVGDNYLFAILVFAVIVEIVLLPFGIIQQKNSIKQARLRPKEMAIRKKYAGRDDKPTQQKMAQEIQELYQKEGYNPMSGCLPLLIQFPLLIALYNVVVDPLKYLCGLSSETISRISLAVSSLSGGTASMNKGTMSLLGPIKQYGYEAFKGAGSDFTKEVFDSMPNLDIFGVFDLSLAPWDCMGTLFKDPTSWILVSIPVITFFAYFFSMKISRKLSYQPMQDAQQAQGGCSPKMMDITMPLLSVYIAFISPAALGVYWIFKSLLGVVKQVALYYAMPLPKFTEEDYKAAEKEFGTKIEKTVQKSGKVVRSLHHIDDEDFEDTAEAGKRRREALEAQEAEEKAKKQELAGKKKGVLSSAPIKKDDERKDSEDAKGEDK